MVQLLVLLFSGLLKVRDLGTVQLLNIFVVHVDNT